MIVYLLAVNIGDDANAANNNDKESEISVIDDCLIEYECMMVEGCIYDLQIGDQIIPIRYAMTDKINEISIDIERKSITFHITSDLDRPIGNLQVVLPRELIQALDYNNVDMDFVVLAGEQKIEPYAVDNDETSSVVRLHYEKGTEAIEIMGSWVIPEFSSIDIVVLAVASGMIVILNRYRRR